MASFKVNKKIGNYFQHKCLDPGLLLPQTKLNCWRDGRLVENDNKLTTLSITDWFDIYFGIYELLDLIVLSFVNDANAAKHLKNYLSTTTSKIHLVFHVSLLKKKLGHLVVPRSLLPTVTESSALEPIPLAVLHCRLVKYRSKPASQLLFHGTNSSQRMPLENNYEFATLSIKDRLEVNFGILEGVDLIAMSFVNDAANEKLSINTNI